MFSMMKPIIFNTPHDLKRIKVLALADLHVGAGNFDERRWNALEKMLLEPDVFVIFAGDQFEMATRTSKSCPFSQKLRPRDQTRWWAEHLEPHKGKVVCITDGNHEYNRASRDTDLYPLFDLACKLGIEDRYRSEAAFVDIGVGRHRPGGNKQWRYVGYVTHKMQSNNSYCMADAIENLDFSISGHYHAPSSRPRGKLVFDTKRKSVYEKTVEHIVTDSFLTYEGYGARAGYRPTAHKTQMLILDGTKKDIVTVGFQP